MDNPAFTPALESLSGPVKVKPIKCLNRDPSSRFSSRVITPFLLRDSGRLLAFPWEGIVPSCSIIIDYLEFTGP